MSAVSVAAAAPIVRVLHSGDGIAVAEVGPVCVVIWREDVTVARFQKQKEGLTAVVSRHEGAAGFLCIVEPTAAPPDEELRKASTEMVASHQKRLKCVAGVIEATGFKAAVARSVLSGITLLVGNRQAPIQYFSGVTSASAWMSQHVDIHPPEFVTLVETVRNGLGPRQKKLAR